MRRKPYPSNLTNEQWAIPETLILLVKPGGRPRSVDMREVVNGILYILCAGCAWRMMPQASYYCRYAWVGADGGGQFCQCH